MALMMRGTDPAAAPAGPGGGGIAAAREVVGAVYWLAGTTR